MEHDKKREKKKRGTRKYTLRWREGDDPETFDTTYTYFGDGMDKDLTFGQHRRNMVKMGTEQGRIFMGEIRGSQIRMPIEFTEYKKVGENSGKVAGQSRITAIYLLNLETLMVESWGLNDDHAGWTIEYNGFGYEFMSGVLEIMYPDIFTKHEVHHIEVLKRIHTPTEEQKKLAELVEREVSDTQLQEYQQTGLVGIPVPSREELEAVTRTVEVARRNDEGKVKPTPSYYAMNPIQGEIVTLPASKAREVKLAQAMVDILDGEYKGKAVPDFYSALTRLATCGDANEYLIKQGIEFSWQRVEKEALAYMKEIKRDADPRVQRDISDAIGRMTLEQNNDYPGKGIFPEAHIVDGAWDVLENLFIAEGQTPEGHAYKTLCGQRVTENFVGLDRFKEIGPPSFTPICGECVLRVLPDNVDPDRHPLEIVAEGEWVGHDTANVKEDVGRALGMEEGRSGAHLTLTQPIKPPLGDLIDMEGMGKPSHIIGIKRYSQEEGHYPTVNSAAGERSESAEKIYGKDMGESEEVRVKKAKQELEKWVTGRIMNDSPKAHKFWFWENFVLGLFYYGDTVTSENLTRPNVHYVLINWRTREILMNGSDYQPNLSNRDNPTGARSAEEFLAFLEGKNTLDHNTIEGWRNNLVWRDQYDEHVPNNLMLILAYSITSLSDSIHKRVMETAWYEIGGYLFVSEDAFPDIEEIDDELVRPEELECYPREHRILRVTDNLKRFSDEDGYYHA